MGNYSEIVNIKECENFYSSVIVKAGNKSTNVCIGSNNKFVINYNIALVQQVAWI